MFPRMGMCITAESGSGLSAMVCGPCAERYSGLSGNIGSRHSEYHMHGQLLRGYAVKRSGR